MDRIEWQWTKQGMVWLVMLSLTGVAIAEKPTVPVMPPKAEGIPSSAPEAVTLPAVQQAVPSTEPITAPDVESVLREPVPVEPDPAFLENVNRQGGLEVRPDSWEPPPEENPVEVIDSFDNAAHDYWRAAALMQPILTEDQFAYVAFLEGALLVLPPKIFSGKPDMARWLLQERPMLTALHDAGSRSHCLFYPRDKVLQAKSDFVLTARPLTLRGLAAAKAAEFVENPKLAAVIYTDLLRMVDHLDEDMTWMAALYGGQITQEILKDVEGFCSRAPSGESVRIIANYLTELDHPRFQMAGYIRAEAQRYEDWLLDDPRHAEKKLADLYGGAKLRPATDKLITLEFRDKEERLTAWVNDYRDTCEQLAMAVQRPYSTAVKILEKADKANAKLAADPAATGVNPLLPLLLPPTLQNYNRVTLAEAQLGMLDIAVHAAAYRDYTKVWPSSLSELERFAGREFSLDPFSEKKYLYALHKGKPRVSCRAPKEMTRNVQLLTTIDFHDRIEQDDANVKQVNQEEKTRDIQKAIQQGRYLGDVTVDEAESAFPQQK